MRTYITFNIGDNDFGSAMLFAFNSIKEQYRSEIEDDSLDHIKRMIVHLMVGYQMARTESDRMMRNRIMGEKNTDEYHIDRVKDYYDYFGKATISDLVEETQVDQDGGACSILLHTGYIWLH